MGKIHVIILTSQPFNSYLANKLEIIRLINEGFLVEIFDLSNFMMPKAQKNNYKFNDERLILTKINSKRSLLFQLKKYRKRAVVIDMANQDPWVRHIINKLGIKLIKLVTAGLPVSSPNKDYNATIKFISTLQRLLEIRKRKELLSSFLTIYHKLSKIFFLKVKKPYVDVIILGGGALLSNEQAYVNQHTKIIKAHVHDFDTFRLANINLKSSQNSLIFIDQMIPYHPDFSLSGIEYTESDVYYKRLRSFFDRIESVTGYNVVISLHPRNDMTKNTSIFGCREVTKGNTVNLVANSCGIITHHSNSVNFAVLGKKPIVFIADSEIVSMCPQLITLCKWFDQEPIMLDKPVSDKDISKSLLFKESARELYKKNFIISSDHQNTDLIDILVSELYDLHESLVHK